MRGGTGDAGRCYVVVDLEATCWEDPARRGDQEVIQIGAVKVDARRLSLGDSFNSLVRPVRYPELSPLCTGLTGLSQADVDAAPEFREVHERFTEWIGDASLATFAGWGVFDRYMLRAACRFHRLPFPFSDAYMNVKRIFTDRYTGRPTNLEKALAICGLEHPGPLHDALADARAAAMLLRESFRP